MSLINLENLSKVYGFGDATTIALDDVNLKIEKGEFVAVMGASGSGKSTLLNIIGLLDRCSQGTYLLDERDVSRIRSRKRAKIRRDRFGFIFQSFNLISNMSVLENVSLPLAYKGMLKLSRHKKASAMLEKIGLQNREYYLPHQLSGGQVQRVAIARALINKPSLIIADEPTGNLDSASSESIMDMIRDIHLAGNTIIMVTHNPDLTAYASRIVYMRDGAVVEDKPLRKNEIVDLEKLTKEDEKASKVDLSKSTTEPSNDKVPEEYKINPKPITEKNKPNKPLSNLKASKTKKAKK
ncbi:ABC transporter ATP-binding protein [Candidatus Saccharibacteria bacterium]|jgi:ABC-type lipoprotein export system ATPase subunit|nr:ABC transporter ATP-binding protein [Candidatus Saccharibacteria bacterium]